ncbi:hypothetical protein [Ruegeria sp. HKCCE4148]|uniref:hypothetical protein n=1 Tax=Ruegeria sp. HKCCE4148 TaxID=2794829 RepID=UPI001AE45B24|nr:hypothetical protein [Ruegeria sp. HKCCE4148]
MNTRLAPHHKVEIPLVSATGFVKRLGEDRAPDRAQVDIAKAFIMTQEITSAPSYRLKSEHWAKTVSSWSKAVGLAPQITNGAFILACIELDVPVIPTNTGSKFAYVGLKKPKAMNVYPVQVVDLKGGA